MASPSTCAPAFALLVLALLLRTLHAVLLLSLVHGPARLNWPSPAAAAAAVSFDMLASADCDQQPTFISHRCKCNCICWRWTSSIVHSGEQREATSTRPKNSFESSMRSAVQHSRSQHTSLLPLPPFPPSSAQPLCQLAAAAAPAPPAACQLAPAQHRRSLTGQLLHAPQLQPWTARLHLTACLQCGTAADATGQSHFTMWALLLGTLFCSYHLHLKTNRIHAAY